MTKCRTAKCPRRVALPNCSLPAPLCRSIAPPKSDKLASSPLSLMVLVSERCRFTSRGTSGWSMSASIRRGFKTRVTLPFHNVNAIGESVSRLCSPLTHTYSNTHKGQIVSHREGKLLKDFACDTRFSLKNSQILYLSNSYFL